MGPGMFKSNTSMVGIPTDADWPLFETFNGTKESELAGVMDGRVG